MTLRLDLAKRGIPLGGMTIEGAMDLVETLLYLTYKWQQFGEGIRTVGSTMTVGCIVPGKRLAILVEQKVPFAFFVSTMLFDKVENVRGNVEIFFSPKETAMVISDDKLLRSEKDLKDT
jgi:hypothetical protein